MKICEVSSGLIPIPVDGAGAVEKIIFSLSRELGKLGHEVCVVDSQTKARFVCPENVRFERVINPALANQGLSHLLRGICFMFTAAQRVGRLVARGEVDVIHVHNQFSGFLITLLNQLFWKKPLIFTTHNQEIFEDNFKKYLKSLPERYILHKADRVVCVSPTVEELLAHKVGVARERLVQIYSGVELDVPPAIPGARGVTDRSVITVARIVPRKNQRLVVDAAQAVIRQQPNVHFRFIGPVDDEAYFDTLKARVAALGLEANITFSGEVSDAELDAAYAGADLFVLTSTNENQGLVILEAMARSVPVICSSIGPFKDMASVEHGSVCMADDRESLAKAILDLLNNPEKCHDQVRLARRVVDRLGWLNAASEYAMLFSRLVERGSATESAPQRTA